MTDIYREFPLRDWSTSEFARRSLSTMHIDAEEGIRETRENDRREREERKQAAAADAAYRKANPATPRRRRR